MVCNFQYTEVKTMGLELDTLKKDDSINVIHNNTTGVVISGFYDLKGFKEALFQQWQIREEQVKDYFSHNELEDFFTEHSVEYNEDELKILMGGY